MRPQSITILCAILFVIGFSLAIRSIGQFVLVPSFYTFFTLIISIIGLYCYYGLWNMKRWCVYLFFIVWGLLSLTMFLGIDEFTTITIMRSLYLVSVMVIFAVVVLPHKNKLSGGLVWPLNKLIG